MTIAVITPETPCSRSGSSYVVRGSTRGFLASQTTEDTGCGLTETPWVIQVSFSRRLSHLLCIFKSGMLGPGRSGVEEAGLSCCVIAVAAM